MRMFNFSMEDGIVTLNGIKFASPSYIIETDELGIDMVFEMWTEDFEKELDFDDWVSFPNDKFKEELWEFAMENAEFKEDIWDDTVYTLKQAVVEKLMKTDIVKSDSVIESKNTIEFKTLDRYVWHGVRQIKIHGRKYNIKIT